MGSMSPWMTTFFNKNNQNLLKHRWQLMGFQNIILGDDYLVKIMQEYIYIAILKQWHHYPQNKGSNSGLFSARFFRLYPRNVDTFLWCNWQPDRGSNLCCRHGNESSWGRSKKDVFFLRWRKVHHVSAEWWFKMGRVILARWHVAQRHEGHYRNQCATLCDVELLY